jgi:hypothetical protein
MGAISETAPRSQFGRSTGKVEIMNGSKGLAATLAAVVMAALSADVWTQTPKPVEVTARTTTERITAARSLVPLLESVRRRSTPGVAVQPGTVPDSPFAGTQTTLLAFSIGRRSVKVDPAVVTAMDRMLKWKDGIPASDEDAALLDEWLDELSIKAMTVGTPSGLAVCDTSCVVDRMTKLDDRWSPNPRERAELRDSMLLDALTAAVTREP